MNDPPHRRANRLAREKSPYLLQHAHNPVDWYAWGEEAFEKARLEDKPIFLSIGYSTCHWCHVMERESFEDERVAELLNHHFVPIKVDREERPDVDRLYMTAMQALGMGGGWPLNVFLTPALEPFFGGTYFPPDARQGRAGMLQILPRVSEVWHEQREQVKASGAQVIAALAASEPLDAGAVDREALQAACVQTLARSFDAERGGFGGAPKFPTIPNLAFLARWAERHPETRAEAWRMVTRQLDAMRQGGIQDHLGGGFHRYSTDADWLVPHFEKMLYDQAQIAWAYLDAHRETGDPLYAETATNLLRYVSRELSTPEGGFASAEDADSEGEEGRWYVWTEAEIRTLLGADDAALFGLIHGVTSRGNFEDGTNVLHEAVPPAAAAERLGISLAEVERRLADARIALFETRERRPRPHRDDKVITAWNGLMISAFARGGRQLGEPDFEWRARRAAAFVWDTLRNPLTGALERRWREGETAHPGQLDDYAYYALGLLDLYRANFDPLWLERAIAVTEAQDAFFWDDAEGAWFDSPAGDARLRVRMKDEFDGAEMAGNSIALANRVTLARLTGREKWRERVERTIAFYAPRLARHPVAMPQLLVAMDRAAAPWRQVVIAGDPAAADTRALLERYERLALADDLLLVNSGGEPGARLAAIAPFTRGLGPREGRATAYVCVDYTCRLPVTDPDAFAAQLEASSPAEEPSSP